MLHAAITELPAGYSQATPLQQQATPNTKTDISSPVQPKRTPTRTLHKQFLMPNAFLAAAPGFEPERYTPVDFKSTALTIEPTKY